MNYSSLVKTALFKGISQEELQSVLQCLNSTTQTYKKGEVIYRSSQVVEAVGLIVYGGVNIEYDDIWGNRSLLNHLERGEVFAETYACIPGEALMVNVVACEETCVLFLNTTQLLTTCTSACSHHNKIIRNLLEVSAEKNLSLSRRIFHTSAKTIRGRLMSYLSYQSMQEKKYSFTIPFNRQQLADYLGVDRSAMSNELGKMQREGLIEFDKNYFVLKQ